MHPGLAFFTPDNPAAGVSRHLYFVLSDPARSDRVVFANVSTKKCPSGEVCTIARGEHDKVFQESYLRFREVRVAARSHLEQLLNTQQLQQTTDASPELLLKLQRAVLASRAVPGEAQEILRKQGVTP